MENTKKETKPTLEQQAAIDAQINTVVAAGAGSGKTTVLSKRFLNLIKTKGYKVDQILTLTFTKKATKPAIIETLACPNSLNDVE